jgi:hypothetical protein
VAWAGVGAFLVAVIAIRVIASSVKSLELFIMGGLFVIAGVFTDHGRLIRGAASQLAGACHALFTPVVVG